MLPDHPCQQIQLMLFMNIINLIFHGKMMPKAKHQNMVDFMNEIIVNACSLFFMCFTEWADVPNTKEFYGWWLIGLIGFGIFVNTVLVYSNIAMSLMLVVIKLYHILRRKLRDNFLTS
jgi:hypothetical protein